jgi:hypothetical protein
MTPYVALKLIVHWNVAVTRVLLTIGVVSNALATIVPPDAAVNRPISVNVLPFAYDAGR